MTTVASPLPRVLVLAPDLPHPPRAGGQMRMGSLLPGLSRWAKLHIACTADRLPEETRQWADQLGAEISRLPPTDTGMTPWLIRLQRIIGGTNLRRLPAEERSIRETVRRFQPDLVWVETPYLLRYALRWRRQVPVVVNYWGTSEGAARIWRNRTGRSRLRAWWNWRIALEGERRYSRRTSGIVTVSRLDADHFERLAPGVPCWAIPNGIPVERRRHLESIQRAPDPGVMIMTGDLSYRPNIDAALWFAGDIFALIRRQVPGAVIRIVGREPAAEVRRLASLPGVEVEGFVPELGEAIAAAELYVLPMRLGSGIRSKLFDVFPLGRPIVTTSIGAEGLDLIDGRNALIRDEPETFARACIELLQDPDRRHRLGEGAKRLAREVYAQERVDLLLQEVVQQTLGTGGRGGHHG